MKPYQWYKTRSDGYFIFHEQLPTKSGNHFKCWIYNSRAEELIYSRDFQIMDPAKFKKIDWPNIEGLQKKIVEMAFTEEL